MSIDSDYLYKVIASERFLKRQGLGNELPFFICPYDPREAGDAERKIGILTRNLDKAGVAVLEINLYDRCLNILGKDGQLEELISIEPETPKAEVRDYLRAALSPQRHLIPDIKEQLSASAHDVLFITGVAEVYPYIRTHAVLSNLESVADEKPLVLFYPGEYTYSPDVGTSLELFGRLPSDKYYRAFNIYDF